MRIRTMLSESTNIRGALTLRARTSASNNPNICFLQRQPCPIRNTRVKHLTCELSERRQQWPSVPAAKKMGVFDREVSCVVPPKLLYPHAGFTRSCRKVDPPGLTYDVDAAQKGCLKVQGVGLSTSGLGGGQWLIGIGGCSGPQTRRCDLACVPSTKRTQSSAQASTEGCNQQETAVCANLEWLLFRVTVVWGAEARAYCCNISNFCWFMRGWVVQGFRASVPPPHSTRGKRGRAWGKGGWQSERPIQWS